MFSFAEESRGAVASQPLVSAVLHGIMTKKTKDQLAKAARQSVEELSSSSSSDGSSSSSEDEDKPTQRCAPVTAAALSRSSSSSTRKAAARKGKKRKADIKSENSSTVDRWLLKDQVGVASLLKIEPHPTLPHIVLSRHRRRR